MDEQENYKKQMKLSIVQLLSEMPNFVAVLIAALVSNSMIVWIDLVNSLANVIGISLVILVAKKMSKDLKYEFNYGIGKLDTITSFASEAISLAGLGMLVAASIHELVHISEPSQMLIYVIGLKVINVSVDAYFVKQQSDIKKSHKTGITNSEFMAVIAALLFDLEAMIALIIVWVTRNNPISWYLSPIFAIIIAIALMVGNVKRIRQYILELADTTLPEEEQMKILKVLAKHNAEYDEFQSVRSHYVGMQACITLCISFSPETSYGEIQKLLGSIQSELAEEIKGSKVNITIE